MVIVLNMPIDLVLIAHNLRSTHNVGALLRTADGLGVKQVVLTGYTPYPLLKHDSRLPHISHKLHKQIHKTALGAEDSTDWRQSELIEPVLAELRKTGYMIAALEQTQNSINLSTYKAPAKLALIVGREVEGIESEVIDLCDLALELPMQGKKESFNVSVAAAMAMYQFSL